MALQQNLLMFYGAECTHCHAMQPLVERLENEEKVHVEALETWHNAENAKLLEQYDKNYCGGVPFFMNRRTGKWLCGEVEYDELKDWALGKG